MTNKKYFLLNILLFISIYILYYIFLCFNYHYSVYYNESNIIVNKIFAMQRLIGDCQFAKNYSDFKVNNSYFLVDKNDIELIKRSYANCKDYEGEYNFLNSISLDNKTADPFYLSKYYYYLDEKYLEKQLSILPKDKLTMHLKNKMHENKN